MTIEEEILKLVMKKSPDNPNQYVRNITKKYDKIKLDSLITNCNDCKNCTQIKSTTYGNPNATLMIVGENLSISHLENKSSEPFTKKDLELLNFLFEEHNVNQEEIFFMNAVNCCPIREFKKGELQEVPPNLEQVTNCKHFLNQAIEVVQPTAILLLGPISANIYNPGPIIKSRGDWIVIKDIPTMISYHPNYFQTLRDGNMDEDLVSEREWQFVEDFKSVLKLVQEKLPNNNLLMEEI